MRRRNHLGRHRLFRRRLTGLLISQPEGPDLGAGLRESQALLQTGEYAQAGELLERLADEAQAGGLFHSAPRLRLQAGHAWIQAGQAPRGMRLLRAGLAAFAERGRLISFWRAGRQTAAALQQAGRGDLAAELTAWMGGRAPADLQTAEPEPATPRRSPLPAKCPFCGANVNPQQVEWLEQDAGALCDYCGSLLQAGG